MVEVIICSICIRPGLRQIGKRNNGCVVRRTHEPPSLLLLACIIGRLMPVSQSDMLESLRRVAEV